MNSWKCASRTLQILKLGGSTTSAAAIHSRFLSAMPGVQILSRPNKQFTPCLRFLSQVGENTQQEEETVKPSKTDAQPDKLKVTTKKEKIQLDKLYKTIELEVLSYEPAVLDSYQWFVVSAATHLEIKVGKCWSPLKSDKYRFPLLKSAFVHKKHQVHYEVRTYHRFLTFHKLTGSTADTFLEYIERNLPEGVGMKITRVEAQPLPDYLQK